MKNGAGANALHDLLSDVTALDEAERMLLLGLLRQIALAQIKPVARNTANDTIPLKRLAADRRHARGAKRSPHGVRFFPGEPDFVAIHVGMGVARDRNANVPPYQIDYLAGRESSNLDACVSQPDCALRPGHCNGRQLVADVR